MSKSRARNGPKPFEPTEDDYRLVEEFSSVAVPKPTIAKRLGISMPTLDKHFRRQIDNGAANLEASCFMCLRAAVDKGDIDAAKYILDRRFKHGVEEKKHLEDHKHKLRMKEQGEMQKAMKEQARILAPVIVEEVGVSLAERVAKAQEANALQ